MNNKKMRMALLFPLMAVLIIVGYGGGLGVIFMLVNDHVLKEWGVVIIGVALVVIVPGLAMLAQRLAERR